MAVQPTRMCIVSRDPFQGGRLVAALEASVGPGDHLEIIVDRRHGGSSGEADLKEDRRRQRQVALALEANGFAIVPASVDPTSVGPTAGRTLHSLVSFEPLIEPVSPVDDGDVDDEDEERLESIHSFQRRQPGTLITKLLGVLCGVLLIALVLSLAGQLPGQSRLSQPVTGRLSGGPDQPPGQTNQSAALTQRPAVTEAPVVAGTPPPARPTSESPSAGRTTGTRSESPRDADRLTPRPREASGPSEVTGTASQEPGITPRETSPPPRETSPPPKDTSTSTRGGSAPANEPGAPPPAETGKGARGARPELGATARPSPSAPPRSNRVAGVPPPGEATSKATSKQVPASPRAELVGAPVSRGWGDSYAVRLLDPAGQPMVDANVVLLARMADGTVENVAMGALSEPGTYRGTVPTSRSTPVDLRVRVTTGDGSVEVSVPVKP